MKGGTAGRTDWTRLETAPEREHFDDFARLAATVAKRYPTVKHFMVWNEFKGFWNPAQQPLGRRGLHRALQQGLRRAEGGRTRTSRSAGRTWRSASYAKNEQGLGAVQGAWGVVDQRDLDAVEYWIEHKKGADFIVVDGSSPTKDAGLIPDEFAALGKFGAITSWLRQKSGDMPVWWAEWYVEPRGQRLDRGAAALAVQTAAMMEFATSGVTTALYWNPQRKPAGPASRAPAACGARAQGTELPMAGVLSGFTKWFPARGRSWRR